MEKKEYKLGITLDRTLVILDENKEIIGKIHPESFVDVIKKVLFTGIRY